MTEFHYHPRCRACEATDFVSVLDLGEQPLANGFRHPEDVSVEDRTPLHLLRCPACELLQLSVVVSPKSLYGPAYPYRSGTAEGWEAHCHALAREIGPGKRVLDIGCLDGVLLRECRDKGCTVQGQDPSAPPSELPIIREFFKDGHNFTTGSFDVVVAQNVFGHVDDAKGFLQAIQRILASDGYAVIECPWAVDLIDGVKWDTIYAEHLSYWGLRPLMRLCQQVGLQVHGDNYFPDLHGGTMRYYLSHIGGKQSTLDTAVSWPEIQITWEDEEMGPDDWTRFETQAKAQIVHWNKFLRLPREMAAYGASAKLNVLLNALPDRPNLRAIYDDTPSKQGLVSPGWHIPVLAPTDESMADLDVLLIGAANWGEMLEKKARAYGFKGELVSLWSLPCSSA